LYFALFRAKPDQMRASMLDDIRILGNAIKGDPIPRKHLRQV